MAKEYTLTSQRVKNAYGKKYFMAMNISSALEMGGAAVFPGERSARSILLALPLVKREGFRFIAANNGDEFEQATFT